MHEKSPSAMAGHLVQSPPIVAGKHEKSPLIMVGQHEKSPPVMARHQPSSPKHGHIRPLEVASLAVSAALRGFAGCLNGNEDEGIHPEEVMTPPPLPLGYGSGASLAGERIHSTQQRMQQLASTLTML